MPKKAIPQTQTSTRPEYRNMSKSEVLAAIATGEAANPVESEVTRLAIAYFEKYKNSRQKHGNVPPQIMFVGCTCPLENVAVEMMTDLVIRQGLWPARTTVH